MESILTTPAAMLSVSTNGGGRTVRATVSDCEVNPSDFVLLWYPFGVGKSSTT